MTTHIAIPVLAPLSASIADMLTPYDQEQLVMCTGFSMREFAKVDWEKTARAVLHIDPDRDRACAARACQECDKVWGAYHPPRAAL